LSQPEALQQLYEWAPDLIVVAAFGQILRTEILQMPKHGCINVHASLLPRWRGAAPIQAAILHGDEHTGISIMLMDEGIDTGPILNQCVLPITPKDTSNSLSNRLAQAGAELLIETLPAYLRGEMPLRIQPDTGVTYASMIKKEDGLLDFSQPAESLVNRVRAFNPWPGAFIHWKGSTIKIHRAHAQHNGNTSPGLRKVVQGFPAIETQDDTLILDEVQPAGKKAMSGDEFLRGAHDWVS
jgi:methionyl-tRNA formyltransferase